MVKYKIPAFFEGKETKFIVSVPSFAIPLEKIILFIFKKYKGYSISIDTKNIETIIELEYN